ncbi:hypothetical protein LCGC14_0259120 [marine sediment metagenome]|uniref:Uncharacterized protein n=1 Tax=marine sediment metagenome TaxID=412755 RepID=A0A0F9UJC1_9ZZZZ
MTRSWINAVRRLLKCRKLKPGEKIGARLRIPDPPPPKQRPPEYWQPAPDGTKVEETTTVEHEGGRVRVTTGQIITTPDGERFPGRVDVEEGTEH